MLDSQKQPFMIVITIILSPNIKMSKNQLLLFSLYLASNYTLLPTWFGVCICVFLQLSKNKTIFNNDDNNKRLPCDGWQEDTTCTNPPRTEIQKSKEESAVAHWHMSVSPQT